MVSVILRSAGKVLAKGNTCLGGVQTCRNDYNQP